jgi:SAM-dependent methyltransferase
MKQRSPGEDSSTHSGGIGPGVHATDGSPVDLYRLLRPQGEPEIIHAALEPGATILELGSGTGRITRPLVEMGFDVVAVDNCAEMLSFVEGAAKVHADIEALDLDRRFDAVLLMSHLINTPDSDLRQAFLSTCRRHLTECGVAIVQRYDTRWLDTAAVGFLGSGLGVRTFLDRVVRRKDSVEMTIRYESGKNDWTHSFTAEPLGDNEIRAALERAGLRFDCWLDDRRTFLSARANLL